MVSGDGVMGEIREMRGNEEDENAQTPREGAVMVPPSQVQYPKKLSFRGRLTSILRKPKAQQQKPGLVGAATSSIFLGPFGPHLIAHREKLHKDGPRYLYSEFPEHYVWNDGSRTWEPRHQRFSIGRIVCANPAEGERYYLRLLLLHVRAPTSFNALKTVDGVFYSSYRTAALAYGLLEGDNAIEECLQEASTFQMPSTLRRLFATLLVHCEIGNPKLLLEKFSTQLFEDFQRTYGLNEKLVHYKMITDIAQCIESMGKQQADFLFTFGVI
ncbi:hypothetical protein RJ639_023771 [Escallonia herrerae]|uniref:Uncharacterized protein n=1 Tax=Escallonia herrerae TaxID=1293975 RepID=A0AA89AD77_9ASTE|nr:hypothetical protein RJ639_023771 [Escallonia herrerae]